MEKKRRIVWLSAVALIVFVPAFTWSLYVLPPLARGEHFYRGRPTSYWSREMDAWASRDEQGWAASWLEQVLDRLTGHQISGEPVLLSGDDAAVPVLVDLLQDPNPWVRYESLETLKKRPSRGLQDPRLVMRLLQLASGDSESRVAARRILATVGPERAPDLIQAIGNEPLALEALHALQMAAPNTLRAASKALDSPETFSRQGRADSLNAVAPFAADALHPLLEKLEDDNEDLRLQAGVTLLLIDPKAFQAARLPSPFLLEIGAAIHAQVADFARAVDWEEKARQAYLLQSDKERASDRIAAYERLNRFAIEATSIGDEIGRRIVVRRSARAPKDPLPLAGHTETVQSLAFSPDGRTLASGASDGTVRLWEVATGGTRGVFRAGQRTVFAVAFSSDGKRLAWGGSRSRVVVRVLGSGAERSSPQPAESDCQCLACSPDLKSFASGDSWAAVRLWDADTGKLRATWPCAPKKADFIPLAVPVAQVMTVAFSPDGKSLAWGGRDRVVRVWDIATAKQTFSKRLDQWVLCVCFSPDSGLLAAASLTGKVSVWNVATSKLRTAFQAPTAFSVTFCPDGKRVACGYEDGTIRLWEVATGKQVVTLAGHRGWVTALAFSADGRRLASGGEDRLIKLWDLSQ